MPAEKSEMENLPNPVSEMGNKYQWKCYLLDYNDSKLKRLNKYMTKYVREKKHI